MELEEKATEWFNSYLSNRGQFVSINGFASEAKIINIGVPQGSFLGPLPFPIYINDLHIAVKFSKDHHFADDTYLFMKDESLKEVTN